MKLRMGGRAVDCDGLENRCGGNSTGGSNPSPSARNIEHPVVIPRDVSFAPDSREFYTQGYQCILAIAPNPAKIRRAAYLAQNLDAGLYVAS